MNIEVCSFRLRRYWLTIYGINLDDERTGLGAAFPATAALRADCPGM